MNEKRNEQSSQINMQEEIIGIIKSKFTKKYIDYTSKTRSAFIFYDSYPRIDIASNDKTLLNVYLQKMFGKTFLDKKQTIGL